MKISTRSFARHTSLLVSMLGLVACSGGGLKGDIDGGTPDAGSMPGLVVKGSYTLYGQLTSGLIVASDQANALYTIDPSSGASIVIAPKADGGALVSGNVVFVSHDVDSSYMGGLGVWTMASGYHDLGATSASIVSTYTDGTHVAYANNVNATTFVGDMVVDTIEHAGAKTLFTQQQYSLFPIVYDGKIIIGHAPSTSTDLSGTITSYDLGTGAGTDLLASALIYYTNNTQQTALVASSTSGTSTLFDLAAGTMVPLPTEVVSATFSADGKSLYADTSSGGIEVITWSGTTATPQTPLIASGASLVFSGSANGKYILYDTMFNDTTFTSDLKLVELSAPSMVKTLAPSGASYESFSPDSSYVTFNTNVDQTTYVGTLMVAPTSTGVPVQVSTSEYAASFVGTDQLLVLDDVTTAKPNIGDLQLYELATPTTPTKLASQIDYDYLVSNDGKTVYYTNSTATTATVGIYKVTLP